MVVLVAGRLLKSLLDRGVTIEKYVNVKEEPVGRPTLEKLASALGGVDKLFSKRAMKYRQMGLCYLFGQVFRWGRC